MGAKDDVNLLLEIEHLKAENTKNREMMESLAAWKATQEDERAARIGRFASEVNDYFIKQKATIGEVLGALALMTEQHSRAYIEGKSPFK
ncbi:MAG: hypothetical protein ACYDG4_15245 [Desulfuromonadaceae bacterium]